jgi:hypothetical protein
MEKKGMETQEIDTRSSMEIQDEIERNLRFCTGIVSLLLWQGPESGADTQTVQPVLQEAEDRLYMTKDAVKELFGRLSQKEASRATDLMAKVMKDAEGFDILHWYFNANDEEKRSLERFVGDRKNKTNQGAKH